MYQNIIVGMLNIGQVLKLPGAVSPDVLHNASLWITLTVSEVVGYYFSTQAASLRCSLSY